MKHVTYRGVTIDMESLMREKSKTVAIGNMRVNARGDQLGNNGEITKTSDQIAREKHRVQSAIVQTGLKGNLPENIDLPTEKSAVKTAKVSSKPREIELPSGDIVVEDNNDGKS
jgi:hypothetical protein